MRFFETKFSETREKMFEDPKLSTKTVRLLGGIPSMIKEKFTNEVEKFDHVKSSFGR